MKDICALLFLYKDKGTLHQALASLQPIQSRIANICIFQLENSPYKGHGSSQINNVPVEKDDIGNAINQVVARINLPYVLFLHEDYFLSSYENLNLEDSKEVLVTDQHIPVLARTSLLREKPMLSSSHLPFQEALLHAWLSSIENSAKHFRKNLLRKSFQNSSKMMKEKQQWIQKYHGVKGEINYPSLSVVIANYNMEKYVETAICSCFLQSVLPNEVYVIDDGSTDNSLQKIRQWEASGVHIYRQKNGGKARALNVVLQYVTTDFILELDADDWLDPDAIQRIKECILSLPKQVSVLYGNMRRWKQQGQQLTFSRVMKGKSISSKDFFSYSFPLGPRIYRTSTLKEIGGFPVINYCDGRMFEDVTVLYELLKVSRFHYEDFTVYNVRKHRESITSKKNINWKKYVKLIKER